VPAEAPVPVQLAAVTWDFPLVGTTRMLAEAWQRQGVDNWFVQVHSERSSLQRFSPGSHPERVMRPLTWPPRKLWRWLPPGRLEASLRKSARRLRRELDSRIDWLRACALVVTPAWAPWLEELPFHRVVYHCIDRWQVHAPPGLERHFEDWERRLLARADGAIATAEVLREEILARRPGLPVEVVRNAVDERWLAPVTPVRATPAGRPVVGFVGALYEWLDWDLVDAVTREMSHVDFVFVGPDDGRSSFAGSKARANVHFPGACAHEDVPQWLAGFDACWIPFRANAVARATNPVKLYEYLALGKPVVATEVAGLESFAGLVERADSHAEMVKRLTETLEAGHAGAQQRRAFAAENTWTKRALQVRRFLEQLDASGAGT